MDLRKLQRVIVDALDDIKAQDIKVFNTTGQTELFDRVIVASATSNRQTRALASHVRDKVKEAGGTVVSVEGTDTGEWVLVDVGDIVVHIMQPAIRSYYNLEELWGAKPVRVQIGRPSPAASRASPSIDDEDEGGAIAGEIVPRAAAPARATARTAGKTAGRTAGKSPSRRAGADAKIADAVATAKAAPRRRSAGTAAATAGRAAPSAPRKTAARKPRSSG